MKPMIMVLCRMQHDSAAEGPTRFAYLADTGVFEGVGQNGSEGPIAATSVHVGGREGGSCLAGDARTS